MTLVLNETTLSCCGAPASGGCRCGEQREVGSRPSYRGASVPAANTHGNKPEPLPVANWDFAAPVANKTSKRGKHRRRQPERQMPPGQTEAGAAILVLNADKDKPVPLGLPVWNFDAEQQPSAPQPAQAATHNQRTDGKPEPLGLPVYNFELEPSDPQAEQQQVDNSRPDSPLGLPRWDW